MRWLLPLAVAVALYPACTFGSLADYQVVVCSAPPPNEQYGDAGGTVPDSCNVLNAAGPTSCTPWQCDIASSTCVQKTRDDDRDGDPPIACGGGDCDDTDPELNSLHLAIPVSLLATGQTFSAAVGQSVAFSYDGTTPIVAVPSTGKGGSCVVALDPEAPPTNLACTLSPPGIGASGGLVMPYGAIGPNGKVAAFVATYGCPSGALGFVSPDTSGSDVDSYTSCTAGGAELPATVVPPSGTAAIVYYAAPPIGDPLEDCAAAAPAPLDVTTVANVGAGAKQQTFASSAPVVLSTTTTSVRPPAMLLQSSVIFVASPDRSAATIWALDDSNLGVHASALIPSLVSARGVSIGARTNSDGTTRLAIAAELGCEPQAIHLALVDYDPSAAVFTAAGDVDVAAAGEGFQTSPSVAWSAARSRWLVTWVASGPEVMARFFDDQATLTPSEPAFVAATEASAGQALGDAHAVMVSTTGRLLDSKLRCP